MTPSWFRIPHAPDAALVPRSVVAIVTRAALATALLALSPGAFAAEVDPADDPAEIVEDDEAEEDLDDLMGGFDDDFDVSELEALDGEAPEWLAGLPGGSWAYEHVDLSGSIATGVVWSYLSHTAFDAIPPGGGKTDYGGLSRLDLDGFLQLDISLPHEWELRAEVLGWYDFAYRINGRSDYNGAVLDVYEWQVDSGEVYLGGPVTEAIDLTIGRKIVNWGRSDTFRVVDVVNPLDNKEPGLVDIEDLRRPKAMVKIDVQTGPWSGQFLVIPEKRYDRGPPQGSDFISDGFFDPAFGGGALVGLHTADRSDFSGTPGFAAKVDGRFSGWDFSLYGAYLEETGLTPDFEPALAPDFFNEANTIGMVGAAGNITRGAFLVKGEIAWFTGTSILRINPAPLALLRRESDRLDTMVGIEYYGPDQLTIALEVVNRHLIDAPGDPVLLEFQPQDDFETALRITRPFLRERLDVTLLGSAFGERFQDGGLFRASAEFEVSDSVKLEGGWLVFFGGPRRGLGAFDSNDRVYAEMKYSF